jgi:HSP20 family protein
MQQEMTMTNLKPFDPFLVQPFDRLFRGFMRPDRFEMPVEDLHIRLDVAEDDKVYRVKADIPGVNKDDIKVDVDGALVTINAEVKKERDFKDDERILRTERYVGAAMRQFMLPVEVDEARVEAKYENGVLSLVLPKRAVENNRRIAIN